MTTTRTFVTSLRNELIALALFLGVWSAAAMFYPVYVVPSPIAVAASFPNYLPTDLLHHLAVDLLEAGLRFHLHQHTRALGADQRGAVLALFVLHK